MGTSKSYLPKVTKYTTKTKINITNLIKTGNVDKPDCVKKVITPFIRYSAFLIISYICFAGFCFD